MEAGRELDALIAEKVMGWTNVAERRNTFTRPGALIPSDWRGWSGDTPNGEREQLIPPYSTDIAAAWQVVERFSAKWIDIVYRPDAGWWVTIDGRGHGNAGGAIEKTLPLAICLAALKALGITI